MGNRLVSDGDAVLAFVHSREAFYGEQQYGLVPALYVHADRFDGEGNAWEFVVTEHDLGPLRDDPRKAIRVEVMDEAFAAFRDIPEFFAALDRMPAISIVDVVRILQGLGARDDTPYLPPPELIKRGRRR